MSETSNSQKLVHVYHEPRLRHRANKQHGQQLSLKKQSTPLPRALSSSLPTLRPGHARILLARTRVVRPGALEGCAGHLPFGENTLTQLEPHSDANNPKQATRTARPASTQAKHRRTV